MKVYLNASDIAACIGHNRWKSREDVVRSYWERDKHGSQAAETKGYVLDETTTDKLVSAQGSAEHAETLEKIRSDAQRCTTDIKRQKREESFELTKTLQNFAVERASVSEANIATEVKEARLSSIKTNEDVVLNRSVQRVTELDNQLEEIRDQKVFSEAMVNKDVVTGIVERAVVATNSAAVAAIEKESIVSLAEIVTAPEQFREIEKATKTHVNTQRGIRHEDTIINDYEKESGSTVEKRNERLYYLEMCKVSDRDMILIGGRIDGFVSSTQTLVEVKRRRNRFLGFPKYEKIQCEIYMHMLGIDRCVHVEEFDGKRKSKEYQSSAKLWEEVESGLAEFKDFYVDFYEDLDSL